MKLMILLLCLLVNVQELLAKKFGIVWMGSIDELFALLAYVTVPLYIRAKKLWIYLILGLPLLSLLYSVTVWILLFGSVDYYEVLVQSLINFKFFLYFALFLSLYHRNQVFIDNFFFTKVVLCCLILSLSGYAANIFYSDFFSFSDSIWHLERNRISGFQFKPNDLALFISFLSILILFLRIRWYFKFLLFSIFLILVIETSSRTALIVMVLGFIFYILKRRKHFILSLMASGFLISLALLSDSSFDNFYLSETTRNIAELSVVDYSQYIRAVMIYHGFGLAIDYFPLGSGAASFGTVMSNGSPIYVMLGVAQLDFFSEMTGVYDSNLASILGEYGFLGLVGYSYLLFLVLNFIFDENKSAILFLFLVIALVSISQPFFSYQVNAINMLLVLFSLKEIQVHKSGFFWK